MQIAKEPTEAEIRENIQKEFDRWNEIATSGCSDPFGTDGESMRLVRNHILYWYRILWERGFTVRDFFGDYPYERPVPPEVHLNYMVKDGQCPDRLKLTRPKAELDRIVWGYSGQYATQSKTQSRRRNRA